MFFISKCMFFYNYLLRTMTFYFALRQSLKAHLYKHAYFSWILLYYYVFMY